jgi:hypothetical protein
MHIGIFVTSLLVLTLPALSHAQTWTTPDGFLSITPPDATLFQAIPAPPASFIGLWVSNDESMRFGVMKMQIPPTIKLTQSAAEEGLAEAIGGEVKRLPSRKVSGHEVWIMTAKGPSVAITQALVGHDGTFYKVMAATVGGAVDNESVNRFISSLAIAEQLDAEPSKQSAAQPVQDIGGGVDLHNLSKTVGGAAALFGIGLLIYLIIRSKSSRQR